MKPTPCVVDHRQPIRGVSRHLLRSAAHIGQNQPMAISPTAADLVPFIPRLTLEWLRDNPERDWIEVEGTLAFIDISGFTAMSERLSSRGRAGAEEVTGVMNATFEALLTVAYARRRRFAEVRRRRAPPPLRRRRSRTASCACGLRDASHASRDRAPAHLSRRHSAQDARRAPLRDLPLLPRRGVPSRVARRGAGCQSNGRDGGGVRGRRDPAEPGDSRSLAP